MNEGKPKQNKNAEVPDLMALTFWWGRQKEAKGKWRLVQPGEEVLGMGRGRWLFLFL